MSITPKIIMIGIDIQARGEEDHCQEEHLKAMTSGNSCQDKNNQPIEIRVL
jgi:hypothetical protein